VAVNDNLVAIITALELERKAVCAVFGLKDSDRVYIDTRVYWRGKLQLTEDSYYEIIVAQLPDMANIDAALLTSDVLHHLEPAALLLVGIAGAASNGSKPDDEALGDVVLGSSVYYYERGKETADGKRAEPYMYPASAKLWNRVSAVPDWKSSINARRPDKKRKRPAIHRGVIACGEKVIADAAARDEIVSGHRKIKAIEMEGYGFSKAVWQSVGQREYLVIKAICDRADRDKNEDWQPYAAATAASFTKHFLSDQPIGPGRKVDKSNVRKEPVVEHKEH
jgi:nucleoside phosphorylase